MKRQTAGVENKRAELGDEMNPTEASKRARRFLHLYRHAILRRLEGFVTRTQSLTLAQRVIKRI